MKIFKIKSLKYYIVVSIVIFIAFLVVLFYYFSSPTIDPSYKVIDTKTFVVNTSKNSNKFEYTLNADLTDVLKDIKIYQYKTGESIELKSKVISKYSLNTTKLPTVKIIGNKTVTLYNDHVDILTPVQLTEGGDTTLFDSAQKLKDIITLSLKEYGIELPEGYIIRKKFLFDDGEEASPVNKDESNILSISLMNMGETNPFIKININQKGDVQRIILLDKFTPIIKEEVNLGIQTLNPNFYTYSTIDIYGSFDSYLPKSNIEITNSEIVYFSTKENILIPFLRLSDNDNTVSITLPVIDPTKIIYQ